jgi:hypothetical protein
MNSFEGVYIEDILNCPNAEYASGLKTRLYYAPDHFFLKISIPSVSDTYEGIMQIPDKEIKFKGGGWSCIDILVDENELKNLLTGSQQRKKIKSELEIFIPGIRAKVLGFIEMHKNRPFVFGIPDANGQSWILGNLRNRAFIETAEASSQKKYEDNSGMTVKISCNSPIYLYKGAIESVELAGSFTKGFSLGFKS